MDNKENFEKENGMSLDEAWEHVKSWKKEGKISEAKRGCKEIIKFFPDHEAKDLLIEIEVEEEKKKPKGEFTKRVSEAIHNISTESDEERMQRIQEEEEKIKEAQSKLPDNSETMHGALSYLWILVLIPLIFRRDSEFVRFHVRQGVVVFLILFFFSSFISFIFVTLMGHGQGTAWVIKIILSFPIFFLSYSAWSGKWIRIPVVYKIAQKLPI